MDRYRIIARVALAALTVVTALSLGGLFATPGWLLPVLGAALIPHAIGSVAELRSIHGALLALIWAVALVLYTAWLTVWHETLFGIPIPSTFSALSRALGDGGLVLRDGIPPVDATAPVVAVAIVGVWLVAVNADWLAFRADAALGALVPSLILLIASFTLERDAGTLWISGLYVVAGATFLATFQRDRMERRRAWLHALRTAPMRTWIAATVIIAVLAGVGAVIVAPVLPGSGAEAIIDVRGFGRHDRTVRTDNPLVRLSGRLNQNPPVELFSVVSPSPQYWRLVALEKFDGEEWVLGGDAYSGRAADQALRDGARADGRETIQQIYDITALEGRFLPAAYNPIQTDLDDVRVVPEVRSLIAAETTVGARYEVISQLPPGALTDAQIDATATPVPPLLEPLTQLPSNFPDDVRETAQTVTAGANTPWDKAKALEAWFSRDGDFVYTLEADYGTGSDAIAKFLDQKEGFCEQFAAAYAAMARSLGIPARVAVGFTPGTVTGNTYRVSTRDAHAWAEVYMAGVGWVSMEPTPAGPEPGQPPTGERQDRPPAEPGPAPVTTEAPVTTGGEVVSTTTPLPPPTPDGRAPGTGGTGQGLPVWAPFAFAVVALALLAVLAAVTVVVGKTRRRQRRRTRPDPSDAITGAWLEALDRLREIGYVADPAHTPTEVGEDALAADDTTARPALHRLVDEYVVACYGPQTPTADAAERAWSAYDMLDAELRNRLDARRRWFHRLDPRPLLSRR